MDARSGCFISNCYNRVSLPRDGEMTCFRRVVSKKSIHNGKQFDLILDIKLIPYYGIGRNSAINESVLRMRRDRAALYTDG